MDRERLRRVVSLADGLQINNSEGMLSWESVGKLVDLLTGEIDGPHVCDPRCVSDHVVATRAQALGEVEQLLEARWRSAWEEWGIAAASDGEGAISLKQRLLWVAMNQRLGDLEAVKEIAR